jgi:protein-disulfide isomerase
LEESETSENNTVVQKSHNGKMILGIIIAVGIAAFFGGYVFATETAEPKQIIIQESPKILGNTQPPQVTTQGPSQLPKIISSDDDPVRGNPDAKFTIIEFSDFQCPFCAKFHSETLPLLMENYIDNGKVNLVFRDFPIESIHPNAVPASHAAECADDQGKFWEMHDMIFENQYAIEIGIDEDEFDSCMSSAKHIDEIRKDLQDGQDYGVTGTPGFFVGNKEVGFTKIIGAQPFSSFQRVIEGLEG